MSGEGKGEQGPSDFRFGCYAQNPDPARWIVKSERHWRNTTKKKTRVCVVSTGTLPAPKLNIYNKHTHEGALHKNNKHNKTEPSKI